MRPGGIHIAYILGRKDSYLLMFSANKLKEQLKFQVKYTCGYCTCSGNEAKFGLLHNCLNALYLGAVHMSRATPANRADLSHENLYFSTT